MEAPAPEGIALGDIAEGSLVKLNENGSPVEFYVAKHDYESGLNGAGRTLLVRKACTTNMRWDGEDNGYDGCELDVYFNETYKPTLDQKVQTLIAETKFYATPEPGSNTAEVKSMSRGVFALSGTEYGLTGDENINMEGSVLEIASTLVTAPGLAWGVQKNEVNHWTRSGYYNKNSFVPSERATSGALYCGSDGAFYIAYVTYGTNAAARINARPAFTLPATARFDEDTLEFKGVA